MSELERLLNAFWSNAPDHAALLVIADAIEEEGRYSPCLAELCRLVAWSKIPVPIPAGGINGAAMQQRFRQVEERRQQKRALLEQLNAYWPMPAHWRALEDGTVINDTPGLPILGERWRWYKTLGNGWQYICGETNLTHGPTDVPTVVKMWTLYCWLKKEAK